MPPEIVKIPKAGPGNIFKHHTRIWQLSIPFLHTMWQSNLRKWTTVLTSQPPLHVPNPHYMSPIPITCLSAKHTRRSVPPGTMNAAFLADKKEPLHIRWSDPTLIRMKPKFVCSTTVCGQDFLPIFFCVAFLKGLLRNCVRHRHFHKTSKIKLRMKISMKWSIWSYNCFFPHFAGSKKAPWNGFDMDWDEDWNRTTPHFCQIFDPLKTVCLKRSNLKPHIRKNSHPAI